MNDANTIGEGSRRQNVRRGLEMVLGLVLLMAAALKAVELFGPIEAIRAGIFQNRLILGVLIQAEMLLGAWLIAGTWPRARYVAAIGCFAVFAGVSLGEAARGLPSCGCLGIVNISPRSMAGFDVTAVASLWLTRPRNGPEDVARSFFGNWAIGVTIGALVGSLALWGGYLFAQRNTPAPSGDLVVLEPAGWVGHPYPLLDEIDNGDALRRGKWMVVLYHYDCVTCLAAIPDYIAALTPMQTGGPRLAFVAMPPLPIGAQDPVAASDQYLHLSLRPDHDWFATTPVAAALEDGEVTWAAEGEDARRPPPQSR